MELLGASTDIGVNFTVLFSLILIEDASSNLAVPPVYLHTWHDRSASAK